MAPNFLQAKNTTIFVMAFIRLLGRIHRHLAIVEEGRGGGAWSQLQTFSLEPKTVNNNGENT